MNRIFWAADSTVQYNDISTYPQTGIGQVMHLFLKPSVEVKNYAKNGRSTKSFIDEGRFDTILSEIGEGDYLFIQFAHNDEKAADSTRYTEPFGRYSENLRFFIDEARNKKANPVLITPIERRCFEEDGKLGKGAHGEYVKAMKVVAETEHVPYIDLYEDSRKLLNELGPEAASKLHVVVAPDTYPGFHDGKDDGTHLNYKGAIQYASFIAKALYQFGGCYRELLIEDFDGNRDVRYYL